MMYSFLKLLPKNHLSCALGSLAALPLPGPLRGLSLKIFAGLARLDLREAERPLGEYRSIGDLFTRRLRAGARPIGQGVVSPVDGTLRSSGAIVQGRLPQIKDKYYSVAELIRDKELAARYEGGYYFNLYLSPQDYHRVHSPCGGVIEFRRHIPGKLWPVNDWSLSRVENLFVINERVVIAVQSPLGLVLVIMVGATNVGKITLAFDDLISNRAFSSHAPENEFKRIQPPLPIESGSELGTFHLGSSVVLLFEPQARITGSLLQAPAKVKVGQTLAPPAV